MQDRPRGNRGLGAPLADTDAAQAPDVAKADEDVEDVEDVDAAVAGLSGLSGLTGRPAGSRHRTQTGYVLSPLAKMALARARMRTVIPIDVVTFVAACPACGADCEWTQEREETRVRSYQNCPCRPAAPSPCIP